MPLHLLSPFLHLPRGTHLINIEIFLRKRPHLTYSKTLNPQLRLLKYHRQPNPPQPHFQQHRLIMATSLPPRKTRSQRPQLYFKQLRHQGLTHGQLPHPVTKKHFRLLQ